MHHNEHKLTQTHSTHTCTQMVRELGAKGQDPAAFRVFPKEDVLLQPGGDPWMAPDADG